MSKLKDFREFITEPLELPIMGKTYTVPPVTARNGIYLSLLLEKVTAVMKGKDAAAVDLADLDDEGEDDLYRRALGTAYDEMLNDDVPAAALRLAGMVAFVDFSQGREAAETLWNSVGENTGTEAGEGTGNPTKTRSAKGGAAGTTTKRRSSGSGTSTRRKPSPSSSRKPKA